MSDILTIMDRDTVLQIYYEDMIKYHGRFHIGGVAVAFKVLELGFARFLPPGKIPVRGKFAFASGLGEAATGVLDGVEMVTRARSRGQMTASTSLGQGVKAPETPNGGKFYFELSYEGRTLGMALKDGLVPPEFFSLSKQAMEGGLDSDGKRRLQEAKEELAASLMSHPAQDLFNCIEIQR